MAILTSGQISIGTTAGTDRSITGEFGGTSPHALSEYKRGGTFVPNGPTENADIPTTNNNIAMSDFYGSIAATPISITHYMRNNSSLDTVFLSDSYSAAIILAHNVTLEVKLQRVDPFVLLYCRPASTGYDIKRWWNTSGTQNNFTSSSSWVLMGRFEESGATAIKMDWGVSHSGTGGSAAVGDTSNTGATYAASDNTYQSVSNNQSIGATFTAISSAECYSSNTRTMVVTLNCYMQKTGKQETPLGSYRLEIRSQSTSTNCF